MRRSYSEGGVNESYDSHSKIMSALFIVTRWHVYCIVRSLWGGEVFAFHQAPKFLWLPFSSPQRGGVPKNYDSSGQLARRLYGGRGHSFLRDNLESHLRQLLLPFIGRRGVKRIEGHAIMLISTHHARQGYSINNYLIAISNWSIHQIA